MGEDVKEVEVPKEEVAAKEPEVPKAEEGQVTKPEAKEEEGLKTGEAKSEDKPTENPEKEPQEAGSAPGHKRERSPDNAEASNGKCPRVGLDEPTTAPGA